MCAHAQLKEEKQLRWKAEDALAEQRRKYDQLRETAQLRKTQLAELTAEVDAARKQGEAMQLELRDREREITRLRKDREGYPAEDEARDMEEAIAQAYRQSWQDKVLRQQAEERLHRVLAQIELHQPGASGVLLEQVDSGMVASGSASSRHGSSSGDVEPLTELEETSW